MVDVQPYLKKSNCCCIDLVNHSKPLHTRLYLEKSMVLRVAEENLCLYFIARRSEMVQSLSAPCVTSCLIKWPEIVIVFDLFITFVLNHANVDD